MDINILIAALSLLVAALAEGRAIVKDKKSQEKISAVIVLLQLVRVVDELIVVGDEILSVLAGISLVDNPRGVRYELLRKKRHLLSLINRQIDNIRDFIKLYDNKLFWLGANSTISLREVFEFVEPNTVVQIPNGKMKALKVLTWKLLEGEPEFSLVWAAVYRTLGSFPDNIKFDKDLTEFRISTPNRVRVKSTRGKLAEPIVTIGTAVYDLKKTHDLRRLIATSKQDLDHLRHNRQDLADYITANFSLSDLVTNKM